MLTIIHHITHTKTDKKNGHRHTYTTPKDEIKTDFHSEEIQMEVMEIPSVVSHAYA